MITYSIPKYNIFVGNHPGFYHPREAETIEEYGAIFNVSDDIPYGIESGNVHWFPVNEFGYWTYQVFYWFTRLMDYHQAKGHKTYVHCHAGAHRSPMLAYLYLQSLGHTPEEAYKLMEDISPPLADTGNWLEQTFQHDVEYGRIPADVVQFMKDMRKEPHLPLMAVMKRRGVMDLPQKTIDKNGIKKPVGKVQFKQQEEGLFDERKP